MIKIRPDVKEAILKAATVCYCKHLWLGGLRTETSNLQPMMMISHEHGLGDHGPDWA